MKAKCWTIGEEGKKLRVSDAELTGDYDVFSPDGEKVIRLGSNSAAVFSLDFSRSGYYRFQFRYGDLTGNASPRFACLLDDRVIGTTYFFPDHIPSGTASSFKKSVSIEDLGIHLVSEGEHKLELRTMFESTECADYIKISLTDRAVEKPLFSFVILSDTHILQRVPHLPRGGKLSVGKGTIPLYDHDVPAMAHFMNWINHLLFESIPEIMEEVTERINQLNPAFVVHTGDLGGEKREYLDAAKYFLDGLGCPYYIARGNHDNRNEMLSVFSGINGDKAYYSFDYEGYHFVVLDSSYFLLKDKIVPWPVEEFKEDERQGLVMPQEELNWLEEDLREYGKMKTFIFSHSPLAVSCEGPYPDYHDPLHNSREVLPVIDKCENVKAVFCGHSHINDLVRRNNVYHFQTPSLIEYPMLYREVVVFPSHIDILSRQVSNKFLEESFLTVPENIFNSVPNGWVIGRNQALYAEIRNE